ncbi:MAG: DUF6265 family protein [Phycisphaerales bacterium]
MNTLPVVRRLTLLTLIAAFGCGSAVGVSSQEAQPQPPSTDHEGVQDGGQTAGQDGDVANKRFSVVTIPAQRVLVRDVVGSYTLHGEIISNMYRDIGMAGHQPTAPIFGMYPDDPATTPEEELKWAIAAPISHEVTEIEGYRIDVLPATKAVTFETTLSAMDAETALASAWLAERDLTASAPTRVVYPDTDPDPQTMRCLVVMPVTVPGPDFDIADLAFITGIWHKSDAETMLIEQWSPAQAGSMVGSFQWIALPPEDSPMPPQVMYELMSIRVESDGGIWYSVRHFDEELKPLERAPTRARLSALADGRATFDFAAPDEPMKSIIFMKHGDDGLRIMLLPRDEAAAGMMLSFEFTRHK